MSSKVTNYQCPACLGPIHFAGDTGKLKCEYCGSEYTVEEIEALYAEKEAAAQKAAADADAKEAAENEAQEASMEEDFQEEDSQEFTAESLDWNTDEAGSQWDEDADSMKAYSCPSCGAEIICDMNTAATSCPYCGNPTVIPGQFGGTLKPDYVIPFKLEKADAVKKLKEHYKGKILLPKTFKAENHIEEIKGMYVPFWLFDGEAEAHMSYHATNSVTHREGDYKVTNTSHYNVVRSGTLAFEKVPVDGSTKMPDDFMDSIEPYDYSEIKPFSTAYMPGYIADKYDVDAKEASERADKRCIGSVIENVRDTVRGYQTVSTTSQNIKLHGGKISYAMMPVWILSTKWKEKNYLFVMNGQTGKMVGDLPADKGKLRMFFWGTAIGASVLLSLVLSGPLGNFIGNLLS